MNSDEYTTVEEAEVAPAQKRNWCKTLKWLALQFFVGQLVALANSFTGVSTTKLVNNDASYPVLQSMTAYLYITIVYVPIYIYVVYRYRNETFSNFKFFWRPWRFAILGAIDLEANYVVVLAYQYTDMMSVQLISFFTIPCALVLSFILLRARYSIVHYAGCLVAIGGTAMLIALDADGLTRTNAATGSQAVKGDLFCVLSSFLYAASNVLVEFFIKPDASQKKVKKDHERRMQENQANREDFQNDQEAQDQLKNAATRDESGLTSGGEPMSAHCPDDLSAEGPHAREGSDDQIVGEPIQSRNDVDLSLSAAAQREGREQDQLSPTEARDAPADEVVYRRVPAMLPVIENVALMCSCALIFSIIQFFAAEWKTFSPKRSQWSQTDWVFQMVFGITMLVVYTCLPILFLIASAAFANVCLLSVNIYSIIWNVTIFDIYPTYVMGLSYIVIVIGVIIFQVSDYVQWPCNPRIMYPCGLPKTNDKDRSDEDEKTEADEEREAINQKNDETAFITEPNACPIATVARDVEDDRQSTKRSQH